MSRERKLGCLTGLADSQITLQVDSLFFLYFFLFCMFVFVFLELEDK